MLPSAAEEPPGEEPGRLLVVDDSGVNRRLLIAALTELGHEVHAAENGRRALELLRDPGGYDVVLLDLMMPVMDGWEFLREQRHDPALASVPVVVITGTDPTPGSNLPEFLRKPLAPERLVGTVRRHAEKALSQTSI